MTEIIMNSTDIMGILPHRYPFLLVDRVKELNPGQSIVASKNVTINEEFFRGHFPGKPVMPGVLIIEAMAQAAGIMIMKGEDGKRSDNIVYLTSVERANFRQPVVPGDVLTLEASIVSSRASVWKCSGQAKVGEKLVADCTFVIAQPRPVKPSSELKND